MTIPEADALAALRVVYKAASSRTRKVLRERRVPLYASTVPGWAYYAHTDSVAYDGSVAGGN